MLEQNMNVSTDTCFY